MDPNKPKAPEMPWLPDEYPRPLEKISPSPAATAKSRFFRDLPPEVRRRILVESFGERILHLDLRLANPIKKEQNHWVKSILASGTHANLNVFDPYVRDFTLPQKWYWSSSICHFGNRNGSHLYMNPPGVGSHRWGPAEDGCLLGQGGITGCSQYPGTMPDKCFVGVQGWLLACRQAYIEGISVLYGTNRFHLAYSELATCLPRLLPSKHLTTIREAVIKWAIFRPIYHFYWLHKDKQGYDGLKLLPSLPKSLPSLRFLYLDLWDVLDKDQKKLEIGGKERYEAIEKVLQVVDAMVVQLPDLEECRVALPLSAYSSRKLVEKGKDIDWKFSKLREPEALWRDISATALSPSLDDNNRKLTGYWIVSSTAATLIW
ncbi:hypothetical protein F4774DRAFT_423789 [Daldinia eschscholtzii]|nr:hypothetical protein F4774DRAFT_423789 [Daldinia eschscholtzii]